MGMKASDATVLLATTFSLLLAAVVALGVLSTKHCLPGAAVAHRYASGSAGGAQAAGVGGEKTLSSPVEDDDDTEAEDCEYENDDTKNFPLSLRDSLMRWLYLHRHNGGERRGSGASSDRRRRSSGGSAMIGVGDEDGDEDAEYFDVERQKVEQQRRTSDGGAHGDGE